MELQTQPETWRMTAEQIATHLGLPVAVVREVLAEPLLLPDIAGMLGLSTQRVAQIEKRAIEKVRAATRRMRIQPRDLFFTPEPPHFQRMRKLR